MKENNNNNHMLTDSLIIEDFKRVHRWIENHEARILRIYLLIISGFVVILGFGQKIEHDYIIPLMVGLFLWITFNFAITDRRLKYCSISYLLNTYYKKYDEINYQNYYCTYMFTDYRKESTKDSWCKKLHSWWKKLQEILKPFLLIYIFGLLISFKFASCFVTYTFQNGLWLYFISYVLAIILLNILIIGKLGVLYKNDFKKVNKDFEKIHDKH